jgi:hypothetical protein
VHKAILPLVLACVTSALSAQGPAQSASPDTAEGCAAARAPDDATARKVARTRALGVLASKAPTTLVSGQESTDSQEHRLDIQSSKIAKFDKVEVVAERFSQTPEQKATICVTVRVS